MTINLLNERLFGLRRNVFSIAAVLVSFGGASEIFAAGELDPNFAGKGKLAFGFGGGGGTARGVAVQNDGKIVVVGTAAAGSASVFAVLRYNPDGSRDTTFGGDGEVLTDVTVADPFVSGTGYDDVGGVALQGDGKIVVVGTSETSGNYDLSVVRYQPDGKLDLSFGGDGKVTTDLGSNSELGHAVRVQGDGKIVVVGSLYTGSNELAFAVVRYNSNGTLDNSFNGNGQVITPIAEGNLSGNFALTLQADGKILVAGSVFGVVGVRGFRVVRYLPNGTLDSSFNFNGAVQTPVGVSDSATAIVVQQGNGTIFQPDRILVTGYSYDGAKEVFSAVRYNMDGGLDNTFDGDGKLTTPIGAGTVNRSFGVGLDVGRFGTSKIVVAGFASQFVNNQTTSEFAVVRYNNDGSFDSDFAGGGIVTTNFRGRDQGLALVVRSGKIIVAGDSFAPPPDGPRLAIARYNSDGALDSTFSGDGKKLDEVGGDRSTARGVAVQPDGKIVLGGSGGYFGANFAVARLNADGTPDSTFGGGDGKVTDNLLTDAGNAVAIQANGKILLAGSRFVGSSGNNADVAVARYNSNGSIDASFAGGVATAPVGSSRDAALAIALQPNGKIVVAGYGENTSRDVAVLRFNPNGTPDASFDLDGKVFTSLSPGTDEARAVAIQPDGKIVIAGVVETTRKQFFVARLNANGSLDSSFSGNGVQFTSIGPGDAEATCLALQQDGRIVVGGFASNGTNSDFAVVRYNANGSRDTSFGDGGIVTTPFSSGDDTGNAVVLQSDGKILLAGGANTGFAAASNFAIVRYNHDGSLDTDYGTGGKMRVDFDPATSEIAYALALDAKGDAIMAGEALQQFGVARLKTGPFNGLGNISTRVRVETGDNVLIGGFIVTGTEPKQVIVRAIGPSLSLGGRLENPTLELFGPGGLIATNNNWRTTQEAEIIASTVPPSNNLESAIVATLPAEGAGYTAIVRGVSSGTGIGLVEVYDLDRAAFSRLANISSRGLVQTDGDVMIGGFIVTGTGLQRFIVRAIGPSLPLPGRLADPTLDLFNSNGVLIGSNDNWRSTQAGEIIATTLPPANNLESAIVVTLAPGGTTAIVRGKNSTTGVAVIEVYALE